MYDSHPASPLVRSVGVLAVAVTALALVITQPWVRTPPADGPPGKSEPGPDLRPSEWFHTQRAYPAAEISRDARLKGYEQARVLRLEAGLVDGGAAWELEGPTNIGGRITAIGYHPDNPATVFIGAADGGVFKTTDLGTSWTPLFDNQNTLSIGAIAMHPQDANRLVVGTGESNASGDSYAGTGVYESLDGGASWQHLGLEDTDHIGRIVYDPQDPSTIYVAALGSLFSTTPDRGVYRSTNAGSTWEQVHFVSDSTSCVDVAINPDTPSTLYAAMWERIRRPHDRKVGGLTSGIWRSTDSGDTWTQLLNGLPAPATDIGRIGLAVAASNPDVVYAIYIDHPGFFIGVYKSTNGGDSWSQVQDGALSGMTSSFGWYFGQIRVDPQDENRVFALGLDVHRSTTGGASWSEVSNPTTMHVDQHDLVVHPNDSSVVFAGGDGGFFSSFSGGTSPWNKAFNLPVTQFYAITADFQNPERLYGGTQDNFTLRTLTGAIDDWESILGGDGFYCIVDPVDNDYVYAEWQFGGLNRSTNGGSSFSSALNGVQSGDRRNWSTPVLMDPNDRFTLYYGTYRVYRSTNQASSWTSISPDLTNGPGPGSLTFGTLTTMAVAPSNSQVIAAGTDDSNVWITQNGGGNWTNVSAMLPDRWCTRVAFDPTDAAILYATFSGYRENLYTPHVFRSTDSGSSWTDISSNLPEVPVNVIVVEDGTPQNLYVGTDAGVYVSSSLGASWAALGVGLPNGVVSDLHLHVPTRTLVAGTHGRSMWSIDLNETTAILQSESPRVTRLLQAPRPNPFRSSTSLVVNQTSASRVKLAIYDVTGRSVTLIHDGELPSGEHRFDWDGHRADGSPAARGVYLARVERGGQVEVQKLILDR